ncbi:GRIP and coiled-coil domain-containing protein 2 [Trichomycterus rosablanca]|uniref:GRIP and coiled-coil domain-containing protein 2 n=1 Tax=Trichomycterus rosablanca TaxID=2290929 RepID=UPI002F355FBD
MEQEADVECGSSTPSVGIGKSKLDNLSKEDLIKYAKKQMAAMQKLKLKCSDLETQVGALKTPPRGNASDSVIQELTERMDAVLLEKAETQQSLVVLRKENEKLKRQAEESLENLAALQEKLNYAYKDHNEKMKAMEKARHKEELEILKNTESEKYTNEKTQRLRLKKEFDSNIEAVRLKYQKKVSDLEQNLKSARTEWTAETEALKRSHQTSLRKAQEELENLQTEVARLCRQHEEEVRDLEEQLEINAANFDMERERLLLLQDELSEQIALKEGYLQDVQEEEEDLNRSGAQKASESSGLEDPDIEIDKLRLALLDLQSQNTMLQEELTFLSNVKTELESDLKHIREEFSMEREDLEFKINELQMTKEDGDVYSKEEAHANLTDTIQLDQHNQILKELKEQHNAEIKELKTILTTRAEQEKEVVVQELKDLQNMYKMVSEEKHAIISEYEHTKEILHNLESELGERTSDFVRKYNAMKDQAARSIQELQEKLSERDTLMDQLKSSEQAADRLEQTSEIAQKLKDSSVALEDALKETGSLRSCIADLEAQLSSSLAEKDQLEQKCNTLEENLAALQKLDKKSQENDQLQEVLHSALQDKDSLINDLENSKKELSNIRRHICEILEQKFPESTVEEGKEKEISLLLNHLLKAQEENMIGSISNEENEKLQTNLNALLEENEAQRKELETLEGKLLDVQKHISKILEEECSQNIAEEQDISALLTCLQSQIHEAKASYMVSNEENVKQQKDLVTVVEERDELKKQMETMKEKFLDAQKHVHNILEQEYSENIAEEQDIFALLTCLQSRIHEAKASNMVSNEENVKQQSKLVTVEEERDELKKDMEISKEKLIDVQKHVNKILEEEYSENIAEEQDISALLTHLQSRIHEVKASYMVSNEENVKQQKDLVTVVEERDELKKQMETMDEKLFDVQKNINKILEQEYSETIAEEQDVLALLTRLQSQIYEAKASYMVSNEENVKQQKNLVTVEEERDELKKDMEISKEKLIDVQKHVNKILEEEYSENIAEEQDISALLTHLQSRIHEVKASYMVSNEENVKQQKDLVTVVEERDELKKQMETMDEKLFDVQKNINKILEQEYSETIAEEQDVLALLTRLQSQIYEAKASYMVSNEENVKQQKNLVTVVEEMDELKKQMETMKEKFLDAQKHVHNILEQEYSENIVGEQDIFALLTCLQSRIHEAKASNMVSNEENVKQQSELVTVVEERDELKDMEISKEKLIDVQKHVNKILEEEYSENIAEEQDISALLTHLQSRIHEVKVSYMVSNEENVKQQKDLVTVVEERDELKKQMETMDEKLFDVQKNINKILEQEYSENIAEEQDVLALLTRLQSQIHEAKASYMVSNEENVKQQKNLVTVVEEMDELKKQMETMKEKFLDAQKHVHNILEQEYSENIVGEQDIFALLTCLQSRIHEAKASNMVSNEENVKQQSELVTVVEERDELKDMEISKEKLIDVQKHINKILEEEYSENIAEEQDISALLTHLQSRIHEAKASYMVSNEENVKLQKDLVTVVEERDELKKDMEINKGKLLDFQKQVHKILEQEYSENIVEEQDISAMLTCLQSRIHEAKASYMVSSEENVKQQEDLVTVVEERDELKKDMEISKEKLLDVQKHVNKILELEYSENIAEEQDISALLTHLQSRIHEAKASYMVSSEENVKQQEDLVTVVEERDELKKDMEISKEKLLDVQKHVNKILELEYSENIAEEQDISALLTHLQSRIHEAKASYMVSNEEIGKQQSELVTVVEERDELKKDMEISKEKLLDFQRQVHKILEQEYSETIAEEQDVFALLTHLQSRIHEAKASNMESSEENRKQQEDQTDNLNETLSNAECDAKSQNVHTKSENKQQHSQVAEIAERPVHEGIEEPSDEAGTQETDDMKRLQQKLCEKESIIAHLKEEISNLQESKMPALSENTKQIEILQKEMKEKDERLNKIKAVAVKARKELENSKKEASALKEELGALKGERNKMSESMKDIIHGAEDYKNLMIDYDKQTELLDKEKEKLEAAERLITDLNKRLQAAVEQQKQLSSEREDLMARIDTLQTNAQLLEAQALDMRKLKSAMEKDLEAERLLKEQKTKDHESAVKELEELQSLLHKQKQELQQTEHELEQLRKDAQQSTLLDMEMADYERLVKELNQQLSEKDRLLEEQESQAHAQKEKEEKLKQEIDSLKSLVDTREEKTSKMKQLLVKTKKDLADAKKEEASRAIIQSSLKEELEANQQQLENYKIQCSELTSDKHRLQEQLRLVSDQHQKTVTSYQHQVAALQKDLSSTKAELESTMSEFDGYKVRVHNVLKQQKTRSSTHGDVKLSKQEREHMESMLEQLRSKLQESQLNVQSCNAELQQLQSEHDTLLERHNKMLQQTVAKEAELRERLLALHSENVNLKSEHSQSVAQLNAQTESLRSSFREQVHHLQDEHRSTVETLQHQINRLESQLFQLQKEPAPSTPLQQSRKPQLEKKLADLPLFELNMAREEGEGMEMTENESVSMAGTPPSSLEQLLTSPDPKNEPFVWQVEPTKDELVQRLNTATRSMDHVNNLLHESEATNAILMEQISVLKSELRRLERNQEREKSGANLEYLKNVLLQFILLRAGSEKQALLPVIHTMLQLSPEEKNKLAAVAQGEEEAAVARGSGWTSYLHSWSGIR